MWFYIIAGSICLMAAIGLVGLTMFAAFMGRVILAADVNETEANDEYGQNTPAEMEESVEAEVPNGQVGVA